MEEIRVKTVLNVAIEWETIAAETIQFPVANKTLNLFSSNAATKEQVDNHCDLVWSSSAFADTDKLATRDNTRPTNLEELNAIQNSLKMKHAILGSLLWNSLTSKYQLEIVGDDKDNFRVGNEFLSLTKLKFFFSK